MKPKAFVVGVTIFRAIRVRTSHAADPQWTTPSTGGAPGQSFGHCAVVCRQIYRSDRIGWP
jgi:hypothetical protein